MTKIRLSELIAPSFYGLHRELKTEQYDEFWLKGGRGSTKSTFVSAEILLGFVKDADANAIVLRRYQNELRDTVFGQFEWTAAKMGIAHLFKFRFHPCRLYTPLRGKGLFSGVQIIPKR
ncbi:MAG: phage terminase large subunit [Candidatus Syntrophopropionicum ammoniitolerans]